MSILGITPDTYEMEPWMRKHPELCGWIVRNHDKLSPLKRIAAQYQFDWEGSQRFGYITFCIADIGPKTMDNLRPYAMTDDFNCSKFIDVNELYNYLTSRADREFNEYKKTNLIFI